MTLLFVTHESSKLHRTPPGHPERVDRLSAVEEGVRAALVAVVDCEAEACDPDLLYAVHGRDYVNEIEEFCAAGGGALDPDTHAVSASYRAGMHAAGAGPAAVDRLRDGSADAGFVAVRPPGHHAERDRAMGFCLFNNIAVTAHYLRRMGERVAIIDWDVHHGNGTQNTFYGDPHVLYVSLHAYPFYPGTGWLDQIGDGDGQGFTVNVPLPAGTDTHGYVSAFRRIVLPIVEQFSPDWVLISNGYDAHRNDPIGVFHLESAVYGEMARSLSAQVGSGRIVAHLEGGYDLTALCDASRRTAEGLVGSGDSVRALGTGDGAVSVGVERVVDGAMRALSPLWDLS